jgi:pimeloyl-ACP methyl ester carboxylesterase
MRPSKPKFPTGAADRAKRICCASGKVDARIEALVDAANCRRDQHSYRLGKPMSCSNRIFSMQLSSLVRSASVPTILKMALAMAWAATIAGPATALADELITLKTRAGVTQSMQLWEPHGRSPKAVILLIPGGDGNIGLKLEAGKAVAEGPHLFSQHRELFEQAGLAVAVLDAPSDQPEMTQEFRTSSPHMSDMGALLGELERRFPRTPIALVAHSRGTISAGYTAQRFGTQVKAMVLLSGLYRATAPDPQLPSYGPGLSKIDLHALRMPVLLIHHRADACPLAPMAGALASAGNLPVIAVEDLGQNEAKFPCGPGTKHWFFGQEIPVQQALIRWLLEVK